MENQLLWQIKHSFDRYHQVPIKDYKSILNDMQIISYPAKTIIKKSSNVETSARFILEGTMGLFLKNEKGYHCIDFFMANQIACDLLSYVTGEETNLIMKTYSSCLAVEFKKDCLFQIGEKNPEFLKLTNKLTEQELAKSLLSLKSLRADSGSERYLAYLETYNNVRDIVPQKDLASVLGLTPEGLCRIIKDLDRDIVELPEV